MLNWRAAIYKSQSSKYAVFHSMSLSGVLVVCCHLRCPSRVASYRGTSSVLGAKLGASHRLQPQRHLGLLVRWHIDASHFCLHTFGNEHQAPRPICHEDVLITHNRQGFDVTEGGSSSGGQIAFSGFLYQIVGTLGLRARAVCQHEPTGDEHLDALIDVLVDSDLFHEIGDNDALAVVFSGVQAGTRVILQFKSSRYWERYPLRPADLAEICGAFSREIGRNTPPSTPPPEIFRIITNRSTSRDTKDFLALPKNERNFKQIEPLYKGKHRGTGQVFTRAFTAAERKNKYYADLPALTSILRRTEVIADIPFEQFEDDLRRFASQFGVLGCEPIPARNSEFRRGLDELIGTLTKQATAQLAYPIDAEFLATAFRGYSSPRKLTISSVGSYIRQHPSDIGGILGVHGQPVRRRLLAKVAERASEHALIVLEGHGGNGKVVLGWQMVEDAFAGGIVEHQFAATFLPARQVRPYALAQIVGHWANQPVSERTDQAKLP